MKHLSRAMEHAIHRALVRSTTLVEVLKSASATEAGTAKTEGLGPKDESAPGRPNDVSVKPLEEG